MSNYPNIFTLGIGGAAGDGIREAGINVATLLANLGYEVASSLDYPSIIRGGHNFSRISFGAEEIWQPYKELDLLIALDEKTLELHKDEITDETIILAENFEQKPSANIGKKTLEMPFKATAVKMKAAEIARSSMALGAFCYLLDLPLEKMNSILSKVFKDKQLESNLTLAREGYSYLGKIQFRHHKIIRSQDDPKKISEGNTALAQGLISAGLEFYLAYPMTPSSSILHYLAQKQSSSLKVIQPENELAVINMALGVSYAGKKVAIGTAGGGFALMQEGFSLAGMSELPLVAVVSQRQAPATGVPTHSAQSDLRFVLHADHGEFPRVVIAPGTPDEAFQAGQLALKIAWQRQLPVIILMDKIISEHPTTIDYDDTEKLNFSVKKFAGNASQYQRYQITEDGISPLAFPGTPEAIIKTNSYEHDEGGVTTEEPEVVKKMTEKRFKKLQGLTDELSGVSYKVFGDKKSKKVVMFWGSTKQAVLEAVKYVKESVKLIQVIVLEPLECGGLTSELRQAQKIINIEANFTGQLGGLIREKTGIAMTDSILQYNSMPFDPIELAKSITEKLKDD